MCAERESCAHNPIGATSSNLVYWGSKVHWQCLINYDRCWWECPTHVVGGTAGLPASFLLGSRRDTIAQ